MQNHTQPQEKTLILSVLVEKIMSFGEKLRKWRKAKGMTQQELASAAGVNVSYISNLERDFSATTKSGKPKASEPLAERFAKILAVNADEMRNAAGYAAKNAPVLPEELAVAGFDGLDKDDLKDIADYINFKRAQKEKQANNK